MIIKTKLDFDDRDFERALEKQLIQKLNKSILEVANSNYVKNQIFFFIERSIKDSPEYESLLSGKLGAAFGLSNPQITLDKIIDAVKDDLEIDTKLATGVNGLLCGIKVSLLPINLAKVLNIPEGSYDSKGGLVDWLKWLLTSGDEILIVDYELVFGNAFVGSRSDFAIMEKNVGKTFSVPPEFSGTLQDNWLTRALEDFENIVGNILILELNKRF
jgi:hypothetical protein